MSCNVCTNRSSSDLMSLENRPMGKLLPVRVIRANCMAARGVPGFGRGTIVQSSRCDHDFTRRNGTMARKTWIGLLSDFVRKNPRTSAMIAFNLGVWAAQATRKGLRDVDVGDLPAKV